MIIHHLDQILKKEKRTEILTKKEVLKTGTTLSKEKEDLMKKVATGLIHQIEEATDHILPIGMKTDHILQKEVKVVAPGLNQQVVVPDFL
jgi:ferredoxin-thioredoxin reductase catalytic subunit